MLPIPLEVFDLARADAVAHVRFVIELLSEIVAKRRHERTRDRRARKIEVRPGAGRLGVVARVARIEPADGEALVPQQLLAEQSEVDAKLGALQDIHRQAGQLAKPLRDRIEFRRGNGLALRERGGIGTNREFARLLDDRVDVRGRVGNTVVVPGRRSIARQHVDVGEVVAGLIDAVVQDR